jgi:hypothetical protein
VLRTNTCDEEDRKGDSPFALGLREKQNPATLDTDLQRVLDAWPTLPEALRAGILAMIRTQQG